MMKGVCVGVMRTGALTGLAGCYYCGTEVTCEAFRFCDCGNCAEAETTRNAPLFGRWTLKVNSSAVKGLQKGATIWKSDSKIPATIKNQLFEMR